MDANATAQIGDVAVKAARTTSAIPVPDVTALQVTAYPNPFNPETIICFGLQKSCQVELTIYNIKGQLIVKEEFGEGRHTYTWDAKDHSSGIYLYKLQAKRYSKIMKMLLVK